METTMTVNAGMVRTDDTKEMVRSMTQDRKRGHVAICKRSSEMPVYSGSRPSMASSTRWLGMTILKRW